MNGGEQAEAEAFAEGRSGTPPGRLEMKNMAPRKSARITSRTAGDAAEERRVEGGSHAQRAKEERRRLGPGCGAPRRKSAHRSQQSKRNPTCSRRGTRLQATSVPRSSAAWKPRPRLRGAEEEKSAHTDRMETKAWQR